MEIKYFRIQILCFRKPKEIGYTQLVHKMGRKSAPDIFIDFLIQDFRQKLTLLRNYISQHKMVIKVSVIYFSYQYLQKKSLLFEITSEWHEKNYAKEAMKIYFYFDVELLMYTSENWKWKILYFSDITKTILSQKMKSKVKALMTLQTA